MLYRLLIRLPLLLALALPGMLFVGPAHAQVNPEIANCEEIKDEATQTQAEICSAHLGCRFVFGIHKTCVKAKRFLNNLKEAIGEGVPGLFGRRKVVTPDAVYEASLSEQTRALDSIPEVQGIAETVKKRVSEARGTELTGRGTDNTPWVYYGQEKEGKPDGAGTSIFSDGTILRGEFSKGRLNGKGEAVAPDGGRSVAEWENGQRQGTGAYANDAGTSYVGRFERNKMAEGKLRTASGARFEGRFDQSKLVEGKVYGADGSLLEEGSFDNKGDLSVGKRYDKAGNAVEVNRPAERMAAAAASREAEERRTREAAEQRRLAEQQKRDNEARAEQEFRAGLGTMNPGQLFARADELAAQGDKSRARDALRALVSRFPDHPLAGTAAQQLAAPAAQPGGAATASARSAAATTGAGGSQGGSCEAREKELDSELTRRNAQIPQNDNVRRLALLHSITSRLRDAWQPCDGQKSAAYAKAAADTLRTCQQIASDGSLCTR